MRASSWYVRGRATSNRFDCNWTASAGTTTANKDGSSLFLLDTLGFHYWRMDQLSRPIRPFSLGWDCLNGIKCLTFSLGPLTNRNKWFSTWLSRRAQSAPPFVPVGNKWTSTWPRRVHPLLRFRVLGQMVLQVIILFLFIFIPKKFSSICMLLHTVHVPAFHGATSLSHRHTVHVSSTCIPLKKNSPY
jgi:hypothetical protein